MKYSKAELAYAVA